MRFSDIVVENTSAAHDMLLKLRKGAAASLNATKLAEVFQALDSGWKIEKMQSYKLSEGGWVLKEVLNGSLKPYHISWNRSADGLIHLEADEPRDVSQYGGFGDKADEQRQRYRSEAVAKFDGLKRIAEQLKKLQTAPEKGKWFVRDVQEKIVPSRYGGGKNRMLSVTFEFYVRTSGFEITSPDGQTYEVFGDYKNGAIGAQTFQNWFAWACENTQIMDEILHVLQMEPHEKKHDPRARYTPPKGSSDELMRVFTFLKELTDDVRAEQKANLVTTWKKGVMDFDDAIKSGDTKRARALAEGFNGFIISQTYMTREKRMTDDWEETIDRQAENAVEEMQNQFVYKNTRKLTTILEGKGGGENMTVINVNGNGGIITAVLDFAWPDGSEFRVRQSIVVSYSGRGTPFYRFPTTFHDVKLPGGVKMGMPSEERMNEVFAKAKADE